jgi:hypothetical protein
LFFYLSFSHSRRKCGGADAIFGYQRKSACVFIKAVYGTENERNAHRDGTARFETDHQMTRSAGRIRE